VQTFGELIDWWAELYGQKLRSKSWRFAAEKYLRPTLGPLQLRQVTPGAIEAVLVSLESSQAPKSINTLRGYVQTMFSRAIQCGVWAGVNPAAAVRRRKVPRRLRSGSSQKR
jgi:hypothetical protein